MGEEDRRFHSSRSCSIEDSYEASNESGKARGLRQSRHGEGEARKEDREGIPRCSPEGQHLRISPLYRASFVSTWASREMVSRPRGACISPKTCTGARLLYYLML